MLYTLAYRAPTIYNYTCILNYSLFCSKGLLDMTHSTNLLVDLRLQRSSSFAEFCKFSLALTQVFDDFLFEVIFRIDISITDQFVSTNGPVLLSNFIFLLLLIEEIR